MKTYTGETLPLMAAAPGNPAGHQADDDVMWNGVKVVVKGQYYNPVYLLAIAAGCTEQPKGKQQSAENKSVTPTENK